MLILFTVLDFIITVLDFITRKVQSDSLACRVNVCKPDLTLFWKQSAP